MGLISVRAVPTLGIPSLAVVSVPLLKFEMSATYALS